MIKNILSVIIFLTICIFVFFIVSTYTSDKKKIKSNRINVYKKIEENISNLPILKNDTNEVIEFNSGYDNENNKIKRNFWKLFKKND